MIFYRICSITFLIAIYTFIHRVLLLGIYVPKDLPYLNSTAGWSLHTTIQITVTWHHQVQSLSYRMGVGHSLVGSILGRVSPFCFWGRICTYVFPVGVSCLFRRRINRSVQLATLAFSPVGTSSAF